MAGVTRGVLIGEVTQMLGAKLDSVVGTVMSTNVSTDPKYPIELIQESVLDAFASVASTVALSPLSSDAFLLTKRTVDLGSGDGHYIIDISVITGPIVLCEVSFSSSPYNYSAAEPDAATAIQDYRALRLAERRVTELRSYAIEGKSIYYPGTRIAVTFVPGDIGESGSAILTIPRKYADWVKARTLAFLFGRDGGKIQAASWYGRLDDQYTALTKQGSPTLPAFAPYSGM